METSKKKSDKSDHKNNRKSNTKKVSSVASNDTDPFVGKVIGNCKILEKINEGGTANIYRAHNTRFELDRVLKILKPSLNEEEFYTRFVQEAQLTARLDHPNILRVFDTGEEDGYFYIEMEHIAGTTLRSVLQTTPKINEREILQMASQILKALEYAHNIKMTAPDGGKIHGILHRDIKPENIMITPDKVIKLMDFGAAKPLNITTNTMQGMIVGTFHYMSPEQLDGKELDLRSDFFSLGIVLYELFTGQKPFSATNLTSLIEKIRNCKYTPVKKLRPSISPVSEELIDKLLSKDVDHRPQTHKEIEETLQICLQSYSSWGMGAKVRVPFSIKRNFPVISLVISLIALTVSIVSLLKSPGKLASVPSFPENQISLVEKGREREKNKLWEEAVNLYEIVPSVKEGGLANEYLEAQLRRARICYKHLNQFTKARSILENLKLSYSDPAIDAYLGEIYFRLALYPEARDRLDATLSSGKGSVMPQTTESRREILYYYANSLDRQYIYVEQNSGILMEAIKAWKYYIEFSSCGNKTSDKDCKFAKQRLAELEKIDNQSK